MKQTFRISACLLIMALLSWTDAWAGVTTNYYYKVNASANPTGNGTVYTSKSATNSPSYAATSSFSNSTTSSGASVDVYLYAKPAAGYYFYNWQQGANAVSSTAAYHTTVSAGNKTSSSSPTTYDFTASFTRVLAVANDPELGAATVSQPVNQDGDEVTLTATPNTSNRGVFVNWTKGDEVLSTEPSFSLTIDGQATYTANFSKESIMAGTYGLRNKATAKYLAANRRYEFATTDNPAFITYFTIGLDDSKALSSLTYYTNGYASNVTNFTRFIKVAIELTQNQELADKVLSGGATAATLDVTANQTTFKHLSFDVADGGFLNVTVSVPEPQVELEGVDDIWTWAKARATEYMEAKNAAHAVRVFVVAELAQLTPGKRFCLKDDNGAVAFTENPDEDAALWELDNPELDAPTAATGLLISNVADGKFLHAYGNIFDPQLGGGTETASKTTFTVAAVRANDQSYQVNSLFSTNAYINNTNGNYAATQQKYEAIFSVATYTNAIQTALQNATASYVGKNLYWANANARNAAITTPIVTRSQTGWIWQAYYLRTKTDGAGNRYFYHTVPALPDAFVNGLIGAGIVNTEEQAWEWLRDIILTSTKSVAMPNENRQFYTKFLNLIEPDNTYVIVNDGNGGIGYKKAGEIAAADKTAKWTTGTRTVSNAANLIIGGNALQIMKNVKTGKFLAYDEEKNQFTPTESDILNASDFLPMRRETSNTDVCDLTYLYSFSEKNGKALTYDNVSYAAQLAYSLNAAYAAGKLQIDDPDALYDSYGTKTTLHLINAETARTFYIFTYVPVLSEGLDEAIDGGAWNWIKEQVAAKGYDPLDDTVKPGGVYFIAAKDDKLKAIAATDMSLTNDALLWNAGNPFLKSGSYYRAVSNYGYGQGKAVGISGQKAPSFSTFSGFTFLGAIGLVPSPYYETQLASVMKVSGTTPNTKQMVTDANILTGMSIEAQGLNCKDILPSSLSSISTQNSNKQGLYMLIVSGGCIKSHNGSASNWKVKYYLGGGKKDYGYGDYYIYPLDEAHKDAWYVGAEPLATTTLERDGQQKYYTTMYAAFPYKMIDGMKAYYVDRIVDGKAHCVEIASQEIPANTPVILECNGTTAKENRIIPLTKEPDVLDISGNLLKGELKVRGGNASWQAEADYRTPFDAKTMRVLGGGGATGFANVNIPDFFITNYWPIGADGADGSSSKYTKGSGSYPENDVDLQPENAQYFPKASTTEPGTYLSNNKAYLSVTEDTPETLELWFDELPDPVDVDGYVQIRNGDAYLSLSTDGGKASVSKSADEADKDPGAFFRLTAKTGDDPFNAPATLFEAQGYDFNEVAAGQLYLRHVDGKEDTYYICTLSEGQPAYLTAADGAVSTVTGSSLLGEAAEWIIEPAGEDNPVRLPALTLTAEDNGAPRYYTTFYSSFAYTLGEGMKAYYVEKLDDNGLMTVVKPYMGDVVPAYTGVILECERAEGNTLVPTTADVDPIADNLLHGTLQANTVLNDKETMRAFNQRDGRLAFYTLSLEYIPATNRAYLLLPEGDDGEVKLITFDTDDQPTAVETIERVNADALTGEVFDLNGRKVSRPQRGIYILNGKKVLIW